MYPTKHSNEAVVFPECRVRRSSTVHIYKINKAEGHLWEMVWKNHHRFPHNTHSPCTFLVCVEVCVRLTKTTHRIHHRQLCGFSVHTKCHSIKIIAHNCTETARVLHSFRVFYWFSWVQDERCESLENKRARLSTFCTRIIKHKNIMYAPDSIPSDKW